ncbi:hypothetical protein PCANC_03722 [Puccinia coronata f. sp. avenae]|uniref:Uncharacterized protein n=1 Tax=Puccinia coronata f. sp. avenae TaxID=200324 RepID=A0A2N5VXM7_9BASI|nr:hypothetical protein PCANC_03722 [Puccinia coronata f. sp. avenae]
MAASDNNSDAAIRANFSDNKKDGIYLGYEYPNEWTQTFSKWTMNHRSFLETFRNLYKNEKVTTDTGAESAIDISKLRKDIKYNALSTTRLLEEVHFNNNPYAEGGEKYNFDPRTGKPKVNKKNNTGGGTTQGNGNRGRGRGRSNYWTGGNDYCGDFNNYVASNTPNQWGKQTQNWQDFNNSVWGNYAEGSNNNQFDYNNAPQNNHTGSSGGNNMGYVNNNNNPNYKSNRGGQGGSGLARGGKKSPSGRGSEKTNM